MEPLTRFIEQNFGLSFLIGVIVVGAVISGIVWLTFWAVKLFSKYKETESRLDALPCSHNSNKINRHDEQFSDTRALMGEMKGQLDLLITTLVPKESKRIKKMSPSLSRKCSPRTLNEAGYELLEMSGGKVFLEKNADFFIGKIETLSPKNSS